MSAWSEGQVVVVSRRRELLETVRLGFGLLLAAHLRFLRVPALAVEHEQLRHVDFRDVARDLVLVFVVAVFDGALDVELVTLADVAFDDGREAVVAAIPCHALVPRGLLLLLAVRTGPLVGRGEREGGDLLPVARGADFGVRAEVADEGHAIQGTAHLDASSGFTRSARLVGSDFASVFGSGFGDTGSGSAPD